VADAYNRTRLTPAIKSAFEKWLEVSNDSRLEKPEVRLAVGTAVVAVGATLLFAGLKAVSSLIKE
jgi:hypothetical protein